MAPTDLDPHVFVIFGATGDLARRKLFPGLFHLWQRDLMPERFRIIGSSRTAPGTEEQFRDMVHHAVEMFRGEIDHEAWRRFAARISFVVASDEDSGELADAVRGAERELGPDTRRLLYMAVPPSATESMVRMLGKFDLNERARLVLEKPFGTDLRSAKRLDATLHEVFDEGQIFRIDHFLGKEAVQNILALRFANGIFEPVWNHQHVCYVEIDVPEEIDIQGRADFMESTGTFRDMIVTHLFQLLGFVALEPPVRLDAESLHDEKTKVFRAIRPLAPDRVVYGQYEGYRDEEGVNKSSEVETFVAMEVFVDDWRWYGIPFYLRTGKAMAESRRTVTLGFQEPPLRMFPGDVDDQCNELVLELTDDPKIFADLRAKIPGPELKLGRGRMKVDLMEAFPGAEPLEAYERLLLDVMRGDPTLFTSTEEVELIWELVDPLLHSPPKPKIYPRRSWGPREALQLPGKYGWRIPDS
ncbi:glucose-6-phosphate dehydrogenase [Pseudonocardia acidicola]|uniref:Glucose-6-phosphate 1-dehydrogenase n=1 Tax=Pseudonocardia acidicola TaxID=2724939 RepID=A0ABX1SA91_9PSEU|nr:glucose-6-phosphate dehydrogenase [Pseudonocardia acidicola]NMH98485.1 glucose-6-phosphate dehydrogenase [Pseudonocardia acidicola]